MRFLSIDLITHFKDEIMLSISCKHIYSTPIKPVPFPFDSVLEPGFSYIYSILRTCILQKNERLKLEALLTSHYLFKRSNE